MTTTISESVFQKTNDITKNLLKSATRLSLSVVAKFQLPTTPTRLKLKLRVLVQSFVYKFGMRNPHQAQDQAVVPYQSELQD